MSNILSQSLTYHPSLGVSGDLFLRVSLNLWFEEELPQLAVRSFAHGFGLHAHLVFVRRKLICTALLVPQMEKAARWRANHHQLTVKILPVQVHVLQPPAFDAPIKTA